MTMALLQHKPDTSTAEALRKENQALRERLSQLTTATTEISQRLDPDPALQELVERA